MVSFAGVPRGFEKGGATKPQQTHGICFGLNREVSEVSEG